MEEVWKDISLASLQDQPTTNHHHHHHPTHPSMIPQNFFLAKPFNINPTTSYTEPSSASTEPSGGSILTLNLASESQLHNHSIVGSGNPTFDSSLDPPFDFLGNCPKRSQLENVCDSNLNDRNHKRMIKNRESAARSRARKQESLSLSLSAYTNELELEVAHLVEENARIRKEVNKDNKSVVVQRLGYLAFTQETRVRFPATEPFLFKQFFL
ncbi:putative Basic-leucine zipper transcription factor family protein [Tripterygium wilfordii]|uniref:Putative Basic-leucine zipper transcription factor family protein n=1 Tax=Tripterygium wilfordii TaxID=458696 RepID=A0A7J7DLE8_TRIWF|nr:putative Basic-leucine zipper transcription factor family protein [Tripterygium wilfordii]